MSPKQQHVASVVVYNPSYRRTAEKVAELLGSLPLPYESLSGTSVGRGYLSRAIHFAYPNYENIPPSMGVVRSMFVMNKLQQRQVLQRFFNVPLITKDWKGKVVVRANHHSRGSGFEVLDSIKEVPIYQPYVAPLIERDWEARLIFAFGKLVYAYKRYGENQDKPWNANFGSTIKVVRNLGKMLDELGTLREDLNRFFSVIKPDVIGIDVAKVKGKKDYVVFEVNFAPGMPIVEGKRLTGVALAIASRAKEVFDAANSRQ